MAAEISIGEKLREAVHTQFRIEWVKQLNHSGRIRSWDLIIRGKYLTDIDDIYKNNDALLDRHVRKLFFERIVYYAQRTQYGIDDVRIEYYCGNWIVELLYERVLGVSVLPEWLVVEE